MGPNGSGKTSLALALMGHPAYVIARSESSSDAAISLNGIDITRLSPDQRARAGLFLSFQNPPSIEGVSVRQLLSSSPSPSSSLSLSSSLSIKSELLDRSLNIGFSGGEKKKMEVLQMFALKPKYAILDEIDSGLDIDSRRQIFSLLNKMKLNNKNFPGILIITHYPRLLNHLHPDHIYVMKQGEIISKNGGKLIELLEKEGYDGIK